MEFGNKGAHNQYFYHHDITLFKQIIVWLYLLFIY